MWVAKLIPPKTLSLQARKPSGLIGRFLMAKIFNTVNTDLNAFVKECLELSSTDAVLEIGFGPGDLIYEMAKVTSEGVIHGLDFSQTMLKRAAKVNAVNISTGRVVLQEGEASSLPFEHATFNKLCTVNTLYFMENPQAYFSEMFRVLQPGGKVVVGFRDCEQMKNLDISEEVFSTYSKEDVVALLSNAGFQNAQVLEKEGFPFVSFCAVATKEKGA